MQIICPSIFCEVAIGVLFTLSSLPKLKNFTQYVNTIRRFRLVPEALVRAITALVLMLELLVILFLFVSPIVAFGIASILLIIFSIVLLTVLHRDIQVPCNCFGASSYSVSVIDLVRNIGFLTCSTTGIWLSIKTETDLSIAPVNLTITGLAAIVFVLLGAHLSEIYHFFQANSSTDYIG